MQARDGAEHGPTDAASTRCMPTQIPGDPKLLVTQAEHSRLSQFALTCLEKEPMRDLVLPSDLGIPISLLNVERYLVPPGPPPPLQPEDQALLGVSAGCQGL